MRIARDKLVAIMALLSSRFPGTFFVQESQRRPLKLGIRQDIIAALGAEIDPKELGIALRSYTANRNYLGRLRLGAQRLDLDGNVAGTVTAEEAVHAQQRLHKPKQEPAPQVEPPKPQRLGLTDLKAAALKRKAQAP
jgi:ProP effector